MQVNGQKNHRSLLIVPLSSRSRVGRLAIGVQHLMPQGQCKMFKAGTANPFEAKK